MTPPTLQFLLILILGGGVIHGMVVAAADNYLYPSSVEWISFRNVSPDILEPAGWGNSSQKPYYLARTKFEGEWFPGYVFSGDHNNIWFGYGGREYNYQDYEYLVVHQRGALSWVQYNSSASNNSLPRNAFSGGGTDPLTKEPLFICRTYPIDKNWNGSVTKLLIPGKLKRRLGRCGVQLPGVEHFYDEFELLVDNRGGGDAKGRPSADNCASMDGVVWLPPAQASRDQLILLAGEILGYPVFLGRTHIRGFQIPGYVINEENTILIEVNKTPMNRSDFELLACTGKELVWRQSSSTGGNDTDLLVDDAFVGGEDPSSGEPLQVCRTWYRQHTIPGRVVQRNKNSDKPPSCVFRFGEGVFENEDFEILVDTRRASKPGHSWNWAPLIGIATALLVLLALGGGTTYLIYKRKLCNRSPRRPEFSWATNELLSDESAPL